MRGLELLRRAVELEPTYAEAHERFCKTLENKCRSRGMPFFRASIDEPFDELVLRIFRLGGVLR